MKSPWYLSGYGFCLGFDRNEKAQDSLVRSY